MDEKSLIKKYQKEISSLRHELEQLRQGMMESPYMAATKQEDLVNLKLQVCCFSLKTFDSRTGYFYKGCMKSKKLLILS